MQEIFLIVILVAFAAFIFWNSRKRKRQQAELQSKMVPGSRVMLSFGLYGKLLSINDEKVTAEVEITPGTVVTVHRQTLSRVVDEDETTTLAENPDTAPEVVAPSSGVELNGEPVYGERVENPADIDAAKRKTED